MEHRACLDEHCRVLIYIGNANAPCPVCWNAGRAVETMVIDDLLSALEKGYIPTEQLKLAVDGPTAPELRARVLKITEGK